MSESHAKIPSEITKKNKKPEGFGCVSKLMIALSIVTLFAIYCEMTFP